MRALVTGATGFLGGAVARRLHGDGLKVTASGRKRTEGALLQNLGVRFVPADLDDRAMVDSLCEGQDVVIHCAARSSPWGRYDEFFLANVVATRNIVSACMRAGVKRLVHISSPSVSMGRGHCRSVREDDAPPRKSINAYAETKRLGEKEIETGTAAGLSTIILRPHAIFGPGDPTIFPRLIRVAQKGWLPQFGDDSTQIDVTYIDNAVDAVCLAMESRSSGRVYNISNGEPHSTPDLISRVMKAVGITYRSVRIPFWIAYPLAGALESFHRFLIPGREPVLTRGTVSMLGRTRTLDTAAARSDLGFVPRVSLAEGIQTFSRWWKETH